MLVLYHAPSSTCSQKVRLALEEKGLEWVSRILVFSKAEHVSEAYLKLNPNGVVPTLVHDGNVILDSSVINEYLEDVFPDRSIRPANVVACAHMRAWRQYIDEVPTPAIRVPSFNKHFVKIWSQMTEEEFMEYTERLPLRKHFYRQMGRTGFSAREEQEATDQLQQTLDRMEEALEKTEWIAGDDYSIADISLTPTIVRMEDLELDGMWREMPRVTDWYDRIRARSNFETAYMPGSRELGPKI